MTCNAQHPDAGTVTSTTLLGRVAGAGDESADRAFVERYGPMVKTVGRACRLSEADADDVVQEVMLAAVEALRRNRYDRERGRFRLFLKGVIAHKVRDLIARNMRGAPGRTAKGNSSVGENNSSRSGEVPGDDTSPRSGERPGGDISPRTGELPGGKQPLGVDELADPRPSPAEAFEAAFDAEWQKVATEEALDVIRHEVEPVTFQAFDLYVRKDMSPGEVAKLLGISRNVVYIAKTRVLARLRELLDDCGED